MELYLQRHIKPHNRFFIPSYHFYWISYFLGLKDRTTTAIRKGIPHNSVDLFPFVLVDVTGVCIPTGNSKILLPTIHKFLGYTWSDADIINLLSFRNKYLLADDQNVKKPVWDIQVSNPSGKKLLELFDNYCQISAPQYPTHYTTQGNDDMVNILLHKSVQLSDAIVSNILDYDNLLIFFHFLDHLGLEMF
jgi:hypothetical protein